MAISDEGRLVQRFMLTLDSNWACLGCGAVLELTPEQNTREILRTAVPVLTAKMTHEKNCPEVTPDEDEYPGYGMPPGEEEEEEEQGE